METLNDDDLRQFIKTFYGYGNLASRFWFIGMEEGGGNSFAEVQARLSVWMQLGKPELADLRDFHLLIGMPEFFFFIHFELTKGLQLWIFLNRYSMEYPS